MYLVQPKTDKARLWINENVYLEPWQWLGGNFAVDHRAIEDLTLCMSGSGLTIHDVEIIHC